jgi:hypothetical protein
MACAGSVQDGDDENMNELTSGKSALASNARRHECTQYECQGTSIPVSNHDQVISERRLTLASLSLLHIYVPLMLSRACTENNAR